jgi:hypothetical protein
LVFFNSLHQRAFENAKDGTLEQSNVCLPTPKPVDAKKTTRTTTRRVGAGALHEYLTDQIRTVARAEDTGRNADRSTPPAPISNFSAVKTDVQRSRECRHPLNFLLPCIT